MRGVSDKGSRGSQKKTFYVQQSFSENPAFYEIMWNMVEKGQVTDDNTAHAHCVQYT